MKTAGFRIRIEPSLRQAFITACIESDVSAAHVLRSFMRQYTESIVAKKQGDLFQSKTITDSDANEKN